MQPQEQSDFPDFEENTRQPIFTVPGVILILLLLMAGIHLVRENVLTRDAEVYLIFYSAFIPARLLEFLTGSYQDPTVLWTVVSYSLLHGYWTHLIMNSVWFLAFGSVVARRLGIGLFLVFCALGSIGGAIAHMLSVPNSFIPMIGASAVVSACMAAAVRFAFPRHGSFSMHVSDQPLLGLAECFQNRQVIAFVSVWFVLNLIVGLGGEFFAGAGQSIAWQAHVGGFLVGLLGFGFFDRWAARR